MSNSLINSSQVQEDDDAAITNTAKSIIIMRESKGSDFLNCKTLFSNIKNTNDITISPKKKRKPEKQKIIISDDENDNSFVDVVVPNNKFKTSRTSLCKVNEKQREFPYPKNQLTETLSSGSNPDSFKTPFSLKHKRKSLKSPMFMSSPKSGVKKRKSDTQPSISDDLFDSAIISSSDDFKSGTSEFLTNNSIFSPIRKSNSANFKDLTK